MYNHVLSGVITIELIEYIPHRLLRGSLHVLKFLSCFTSVFSDWPQAMLHVFNKQIASRS